jgi:hypothetical protein
MKPSPSYNTTGHNADGSTAKVEVGKGDWVAIDVGVAPTDALKAEDGVGVAAVDEGVVHAPRSRALISKDRMPRR